MKKNQGRKSAKMLSLVGVFFTVWLFYVRIGMGDHPESLSAMYIVQYPVLFQLGWGGGVGVYPNPKVN